MSTARRVMGEDIKASRAGSVLAAHAPLVGRVAMALLGDGAEVERVLEQVAREASRGAERGASRVESGGVGGGAPDDEAMSAPPDGLPPRVWLLGLVRAACATRLSAIPLRTARLEDMGPRTLRLGSEAPSAARSALSRLKPTEREAVVLHLVGGLDCTEIATICRLDVDAAKARVARGIELLMAEGSEGGAR